MNTPSNPFGATGPTVGYLYQCRYGLFVLLERTQKDASVELSIERFDDIALQQGGSLTEQTQTKHHLGSVGDLTDCSVDLWKTLRVWSVAIKAGTLQPSNTLLFLVTTAIAPPFSAASQLRRENRAEAWALQTLLYVAHTSMNKTNASAYEAFLNLTSQQQAAMLTAIRVLDQEPNIVDTLPRIRQLLTYACRPEHLDHLVERLEGW